MNKVKLQPGTVIFVVTLVLLLVSAFTIAQGAVSERERRFEEHRGEIFRNIGQQARPISSDLPSHAKINIVYLYFTYCLVCEREYLESFQAHVPALIGNLSVGSIYVDAINYAIRQEMGGKFFEAFNVSRSLVGRPLLFVFGEGEGFVFDFPQGAYSIPAAVDYLVGDVASLKSEPRPFQAFATYALGLMVGTDPCFIAVASYLYVLSGTSRRRVAKRVLAMATGVVYAYIVLLLFSVSLQTTNLWSFLPFTRITSIVMLLVAVALLIDGGYSLLAKLRGSNVSSLLFKTPSDIASVIRRIVGIESLPADVLLGSFLAVFKLPCMAPQLFIVMLLEPRKLLPYVIAFTSGVLSSTIAIAILIAIGIMGTANLLRVKWYGRSIQRIAVGLIMGWAALTLLS